MTDKQKWNDNGIQFPRLLFEIQANIEFDSDQKEDLCSSMDLEWNDILEIFERATIKFETIKENL